MCDDQLAIYSNNLSTQCEANADLILTLALFSWYQFHCAEHNSAMMMDFAEKRVCKKKYHNSYGITTHILFGCRARW